MKMLVEVLNLIKDNMSKSGRKKIVLRRGSGYGPCAGPFSQFLEPDAHKEMKSETEGEFRGLGIRISSATTC